MGNIVDIHILKTPITLSPRYLANSTNNEGQLTGQQWNGLIVNFRPGNMAEWIKYQRDISLWQGRFNFADYRGWPNADEQSWINQGF